MRPALAEPTLMPSISTSTWSDSVPRRNSVVFLPKPPLFASDTPGTWRNRLRHAARLAALDILAVDDAHRRQALGSGLGGTGGGHHLVGKADRFGQAQGRRAAQRHGCRGQENSVHALRCSVALTRATWVEADGGRSDGRRRPTAPSAMPWVRQAGLRARERSAGRFQPRLPMPEHSGHRAAV